MQTNNFIFEIGVDEIPAQYVEEMAQSFQSVLSTAFVDNLLEFSSLKVNYTPRRLVAIVENLCDEQKVNEEEVKGPSLDRAYDQNNNPTPALLGFLKGKNKTLEDVYVKELNGAKYVYVSIKNEARKTSAVLSEILPNVISKIYLPNAMHWGNFKFKFVRPIRWLLAVFGNEIIDFSIECAKSSNYTMGHRTLSNKQIEVKCADDYQEILRDNFVVLNAEIRKDMILNQISDIETKFNVNVLTEPELLYEIVNLVECPTCGVGYFPKEFLQLPDPVVVTPMQGHQRYFPVYQNDKLTNMFVYVRNGNDYKMEQVAHGNERVLNARLKDGEFFYNEDIQTTLEEKASKLDQVLYQEKLGSMFDKSQRVNKIAKYLASICGLSIEKIDLTTKLYKADLVSKVVGEFSELQGVMGEIYAKYDKIDNEVASAIGEQYMPVKAGGDLPQTKLGSLIAIADKLDSILGLTAVGLMGKGSNDPYGMRRQAIGILAIQQKFNYSLDFSIIIPELANIYEEYLLKAGIDKNEYVNSLINFFAQRIKGILIDEKEIDYQIVDQLPVDRLNIFELITKSRVMQNIQNEEWFNIVKQAFIRVQKILKNKSVSSDVIDANLFDCEDEKNLYNEYSSILNNYNTQFKESNFEIALRSLIKLANLINIFFDNNLVLSQNQEVCQNRINVLAKILILYTNIFNIL